MHLVLLIIDDVIIFVRERSRLLNGILVKECQVILLVFMELVSRILAPMTFDFL